MSKLTWRELAFALCAAATLAASATAQDKPDPPPEQKSPAPNPKVSTTQLEGWGFGAGLSLSIFKKDQRIENAEVINGIVRVTEDQRVLTRVMLETHYLSRWWTEKLGMEDRCMDRGKIKECGIGFFIAAQPGTTNTIEAIGGGVMYGHRRNPGPSDTDTSAFNFGIGLVVDPYAKTLGDGIQKDQPLPAGETVVRFKERPIWGWLLFASFSF